jgi:hypothetical protein
MHILDTQKPAVIALTMASFSVLLIASVMTTYLSAQDKTSPLVVRVAVFSNDQGRLDDYRDFVNGHLFPTLRTVPGYLGTFLGRDATSGQLISLSFWRSEADAVTGEEAVGRAIRALPQGSAPRPSRVENYVVEYRDIKEPLSK